MNSNYLIRLVKEADTKAVLDIYKYYVDHTIISFEYEAPNFEEYLLRIKTNAEKYPWLVCTDNEKVVGFAYGSTHRYRTAYQWSPESTIYIAPEFHTKGIGRVLYETLVSILKLQGYCNVFAGVALPNEKSIGFHLAMGFEEIGVFRNVGYKHGNWHHTQWFQLELIKPIKNPPTPKKLYEIISTAEFTKLLESSNNKF